jgi:hypothetical protein
METILKLFGFRVRKQNSVEEREIIISATSKEESNKIFELWNKKYNYELLEIKSIRKSKKYERYLDSDYYQRELKLVGLKENE